MGAHGMCSAQPPPDGVGGFGVFSLLLSGAGDVGGLPVPRKCRWRSVIRTTATAIMDAPSSHLSANLSAADGSISASSPV